MNDINLPFFGFLNHPIPFGCLPCLAGILRYQPPTGNPLWTGGAHITLWRWYGEGLFRITEAPEPVEIPSLPAKRALEDHSGATEYPPQVFWRGIAGRRRRKR